MSATTEKARRIVAKARAQAHAIVSLARLKRKEILARARTKSGPKQPSDDNDSPEAIAKRRADFSNIGLAGEQKRRREKAEKQTAEVNRLTASQMRRLKPLVHSYVEGLVYTINSVMGAPRKGETINLVAIRTQFRDKREVDRQLAELVRVGFLRLIDRSEWEQRRGYELPLDVAKGGYPSDRPQYPACERITRK
jgi:hypothetical protein